jgi:hypothetical protein
VLKAITTITIAAQRNMRVSNMCRSQPDVHTGGLRREHKS